MQSFAAQSSLPSHLSHPSQLTAAQLLAVNDSKGSLAQQLGLPSLSLPTSGLSNRSNPSQTSTVMSSNGSMPIHCPPSPSSSELSSSRLSDVADTPMQCASPPPSSASPCDSSRKYSNVLNSSQSSGTAPGSLDGSLNGSHSSGSASSNGTSAASVSNGGSSSSSSSRSKHSSGPNPWAEKLKPRCNCVELQKVECHLETKDLWDKFNKLGTEMIITKTGR
jgi:hypothetical protein